MRVLIGTLALAFAVSACRDDNRSQGDVGFDADVIDAADVNDATDGGIDAGDAADVGDTPDADMDAAPDAPDTDDAEVDGTEPQACGGFEPLTWNEEPAAPGDPCGMCALGVLICEGADALACKDEVGVNACGGCEELDAEPGAACGACGVRVCDGTDAVTCAEPAECGEPLSAGFVLLPSDRFEDDGAAEDSLGRDVLWLGDDRLLVSAPDDSEFGANTGVVLEYERIDGAWVSVDALRPPEPQSGERFGYRLAGDADTLFVSAYRSSRFGDEAGAVFAFTSDASGWTHTATIAPPNPRTNARFGAALDSDGMTLAVGEMNDNEVTLLGAAYAFRMEDGVWRLDEAFEGERAGLEDGFGVSVAVDGDAMAVGAFLEDERRGNVHVYERDGDGWTHTELPHPDSVAVGSAFGWRLSMDGNRLATGAYGVAQEATASAGAVFVYERDGGTWSLDATLQAEEPQSGARLGDSVAIEGDRVVAGAFRRAAPEDRSGAAHLFERAGEGWTETVLSPGPGALGARMGRSVALRSDDVASGAVDDATAGEDAGAFFTFRLDEEPPVRVGPVLSPRALTGDSFGRAIAADGGVLLIGADEEDVAGESSGLVSRYMRVATGWALQESITAPAAQTRARFGNAVDLHGGWAFVGARNFDERSGAVHVFRVRRSGALDPVVDLRAPEPVPGDRFGFRVAVADGIAAISTMRDDPDVAHSGTVYVYTLDEDEWSLAATLRGQEGDRFGDSIAVEPGAVYVGAPHANERAGHVVVHRPSGDGWAAVETLTREDAGPAQLFGHDVAVDGDVLVVGVLAANGAAAACGVATVFERIDGEWSEVQTLAAETADVADQFGFSVAVEGTRIAVGAHRDRVDGNTDGSVSVYDRGTDEWALTEMLFADNDGAGESFGYDVDVSEGRVFCSAVGDDRVADGAGAVYVFE